MIAERWDSFTPKDASLVKETRVHDTELAQDVADRLPHVMQGLHALKGHLDMQFDAEQGFLWYMGRHDNINRLEHYYHLVSGQGIRLDDGLAQDLRQFRGMVVVHEFLTIFEALGTGLREFTELIIDLHRAHDVAVNQHNEPLRIDLGRSEHAGVCNELIGRIRQHIDRLVQLEGPVRHALQGGPSRLHALTGGAYDHGERDPLARFRLGRDEQESYQSLARRPALSQDGRVTGTDESHTLLEDLEQAA
ncbi:hypothetical protein AUJ68_02950 [Candidatus Woesearchaeota archaeon CG1_02_57_44]|nr:MAG: hypothetical protein AUJ68_02950 [Candidatus Woesearchaeota archaeon CG1_02_57_44]